MDFLSILVGILVGASAVGLMYIYKRGQFIEAMEKAEAMVDRVVDEADDLLEQLMDTYDKLDAETEHAEALQQELFDAAATGATNARVRRLSLCNPAANPWRACL